MRSSVLVTHAEELLWSLWTEMGLNGVVRNHSWAAIDPEPLIVATPRLGAGDARLVEEAGGWCAHFADRLSVSRLEGLLDFSSETTRIEFVAFAHRLRNQTKIKWPVDKWQTKFAAGRTDRSTPRKRTHRSAERVSLPLRRPAMFRVRMRALVGVGARADILSELVARTGSWTSATDLQTLGYSKRNVARVLAELEEADLVRSVRTGPAFKYRLDDAQRLAEFAGPVPETFPPWREIFEFVVTALHLEQIGQDTSVSSRVESTAQHRALVEMATGLWLDSPPPIRGQPELPHDLMVWANSQLAALAAGDSAAFRRPGSDRHHAIEDKRRHSPGSAQVPSRGSRSVRSKVR